jgi:hypothetical protein
MIALAASSVSDWRNAMSARIKWPARCAFVGVVLQSIGCAADTAGTEALGLHQAHTAEEIALPDGNTTAPGASGRGSAIRPTSGFVAATRDPKASPYLVTESALIANGGISSEQSDPLLESRALFAEALQRMGEDEKKSMEAQDLAKHYRSALDQAMGAHGVVEDLTCGLSLCMGSVSARSRADHDAWAERLYENAGAARHVIVDVFEADGDRLQNRFLFSADAAIKAIVLPPKRDR